MPPGFSILDADVDLWMPVGFSEESRKPEGRWLTVVARLRDRASLMSAQADMTRVAAAQTRRFPDFNTGWTARVVPLHAQVTGRIAPALTLLGGAVSCVLLIGCANVANLLLAHGSARRRELAMRAALGASRGRIIRQLLTESVLLSLLGGIGGLLLAFWGVNAIHRLGTKSVPRLHDVGIDGVVLLFTAAVSIAAGIIFGLAPALRLGTVDLHTSLKASERGSSGGQSLWGRGGRLRGFLVAGELALCVMVLIAAGLLVRSFARVHDVAPGFNPARVLTLELTMAGRKYADAARVYETYRELWDRLHAIPGVTAAGGVTALPLSQMFAWGPITVEGRNAPAGEKFINVDIRTVAGDYFKAMEIPLVRGRFFNDQDTRETPIVVVVDQRRPGGDVHLLAPAHRTARGAGSPAGPR